MKRSYWRQLSESIGARQFRVYPTLQGEITADVAIVGAGITGLSTALELLYRGKSVVVFEAESVGFGTTGRSSGHLDAHPEMGPRKLLKQLGREKASQYVQLRKSAISAIESRCGVEAKFKAIPAYMYSENYRDLEQLKDEFDAALEIGLSATWQDSMPLSHAAFGYRIDGMGRIDTLAYVRGLAELVTEAGGKIYENTLVQPPLANSDGMLHADNGKVHCSDVVCAVHCNYTDSLKLYLQTPPFQSYVLAARVSNPPPDALYWDNASPYFYTRIASADEPNVLVVGGCDHHTGSGHSVQSMKELESYVKERYQVEEILSRWSAELFEPSDGLPMIGSLGSHGSDQRPAGSEHDGESSASRPQQARRSLSKGQGKLWVTTGLSGIGLTWGTAAGWIIADQMLGKTTPLQDELSPGRFGFSGLGKMASEQQEAVASYSERIRPAESFDPSTLRNGEGLVGTVDGEFVAVCRDHSGCLHSQSPVCSHMGGVLRWNEVEQTWDCPVHGGRFAPDGSRVYGPPSTDLEKCEVGEHSQKS